jgi:hypothetical protein
MLCKTMTPLFFIRATCWYLLCVLVPRIRHHNFGHFSQYRNVQPIPADLPRGRPAVELGRQASILLASGTQTSTNNDTTEASNESQQLA